MVVNWENRIRAGLSTLPNILIGTVRTKVADTPVKMLPVQAYKSNYAALFARKSIMPLPCFSICSVGDATSNTFARLAWSITVTELRNMRECLLQEGGVMKWKENNLRHSLLFKCLFQSLKSGPIKLADLSTSLYRGLGIYDFQGSVPVICWKLHHIGERGRTGRGCKCQNKAHRTFDIINTQTPVLYPGACLVTSRRLGTWPGAVPEKLAATMILNVVDLLHPSAQIDESSPPCGYLGKQLTTCFHFHHLWTVQCFSLRFNAHRKCYFFRFS